jgi:hypothetical protein
MVQSHQQEETKDKNLDLKHLDYVTAKKNEIQKDAKRSHQGTSRKR